MKKVYEEINKEINYKIDENKLNYILDKLDRYTVPEPTAIDTDIMLNKIYNLTGDKPYVANEFNSEEESLYVRGSWYQVILNLIGDQLQLKQTWFWVFNIILAVVGLKIPVFENSLPPVVYMLVLGVIIGISYLYTNDSISLQLIELSSPVSREQLAVARLILISSLQICLFYFLLVFNKFFQVFPEASFNITIDKFLLPLMFFGIITLFLIIRTGYKTGIAISTLLWTVMIIYNYNLEQTQIYNDVWTVFSSVKGTQIIYLVISLLLILLGIIYPLWSEEK